MKTLKEINDKVLKQAKKLWGNEYGTIVQNSVGEMTDKGTVHSYIPEYEKLFEDKRLDTTKLLEIGIGHGGSIKLWHDYFPNAEIHAINIESPNQPPYWFHHFPRITSYIKDAYTLGALELFKDIKFDIIIDDGPHTEDSQIYAAKHYSKLLNKGGILVIEDVKYWSIKKITKVLPYNVGDKHTVKDLRHIKNRDDDILIIYESK